MSTAVSTAKADEKMKCTASARVTIKRTRTKVLKKHMAEVMVHTMYFIITTCWLEI